MFADCLTDYCQPNGRVPELSEMEVKSLRLATELRLSTDQADAVARCNDDMAGHDDIFTIS